MAPGAHTVDKNQPPAVHPVAGVVASWGEVLLLAETAVLNSAVFLSSAAAAASAAAFAILASRVPHCPRVDLQVQPAAAQRRGLPARWC